MWRGREGAALLSPVLAAPPLDAPGFENAIRPRTVSLRQNESESTEASGVSFPLFPAANKEVFPSETGSVAAAKIKDACLNEGMSMLYGK